MSYTLTVVNHTPITIQNGSTDNTTSLTLVGKNYPNYGQLLQQDLINLLQNWAGSSQPVSAVTGQLWWNTTSNSLQIYTGSAFKTVGGATVSATAPTATPIQGDFWFKSDDQTVYVYNGSSWALVGPSYTSAQQYTTSIGMTITDNTSSSHTVLAYFVGNYLTGILSKDPAFTPVNGVTTDGKTISTLSTSGFSTILPGYNINTTIFGGSTPPLSGLLVTNAQPYITSLGNLTSLNVNGTSTFTGSILPSTSNAYTLGSSTYWWATAYTQSIQAKYADLAENYLSDDLYEPGTVVEFGGDAEITISTTIGGTNVAGVISTKPAYLMNQNDNPFMLPVALQGRVPCKVVGPVTKGDLLVSNGSGAAMATAEPKVGSVIGKALQSIADTNIQTIEVVVGVR